MAITYLAKVDGVSEVRARVNLFGEFFHKKVKEELVGFRVKHSDSLTKCVF